MIAVSLGYESSPDPFACMGCGYRVAGAGDEDLCPKCGLLVRFSRVPKKAGLGARLLLAGWAAWPLIITVWWGMTVFGPGGDWRLIGLLAATLVPLVPAGFGGWWLAAARPERHVGAAGWTTRGLWFAAIGGVLATSMLPLLTDPRFVLLPAVSVFIGGLALLLSLGRLGQLAGRPGLWWLGAVALMLMVLPMLGVLLAVRASMLAYLMFLLGIVWLASVFGVWLWGVIALLIATLHLEPRPTGRGFTVVTDDAWVPPQRARGASPPASASTSRGSSP
jgi:hypothetical protein